MLDALERERTGDEAAAEGNSVFAAYNFALAAVMHAQRDRAYWSRLLITKILNTLNAIGPTQLVSVGLLSMIERSLHDVATLLGPDDEATSNLRRALASVSALRAKNPKPDPTVGPPRTSLD